MGTKEESGVFCRFSLKKLGNFGVVYAMCNRKVLLYDLHRKHQEGNGSSEYELYYSTAQCFTITGKHQSHVVFGIKSIRLSMYPYS